MENRLVLWVIVLFGGAWLACMGVVLWMIISVDLSAG